MTVTVWLMVTYLSGTQPTMNRLQRFDTLQHCTDLVNKVNEAGAKAQATKLFCAEGLMEQIGPATTPNN